MRTAPALPELQRQFLAALYVAGEPGPLAAIAGNGLAPAARLRIYRRSCHAIQSGALRTSYPAVLALVGEAWFEQAASGYRMAHPSHSGNLQDYGGRFAEYLETRAETRDLPYLADVARLEWLRQQVALAAEAAPDAMAAQRLRRSARPRVALHPGVRLFASRHAVLTIWRYATTPSDDRLRLPDAGENVVLWRADGEVAMAAPDAASFACLAALARGRTLGAAQAAAVALDPAFDLAACVDSLYKHGLLVARTPAGNTHLESPTCP